ncbi:SCO4226 family nickel-binding protein [Streptomyces sp. NPDC049577]|uniref:SCO4226 family nickel-binding protein n=1 Tax=Streptomyces sp. NPDC049577 TaxID=3155153 RepID=UPI0034145658
MAKFMDVHRGMEGITQDQLVAAHRADLAIERDEGVHFERAWADPKDGVVYCLSEAPSADAVKRVHERAGHPVTEVHPVPMEVS